MLLLQFGNMSSDLTLYNTELFAKQVKPQLDGLFENEWENRWWPQPLPRRRTARCGRGSAARRERAAREAAMRAASLGEDVRVLEKGRGRAARLPRAFGGIVALDAVPRRASPSAGASSCRRCPASPAAGGAFRKLDDLPDWLAATLDLLEASGPRRGRPRRPRRRRAPRRRGCGACARARRRSSCCSRRSASSTSASPSPTSSRAVRRGAAALLDAPRRVRGEHRVPARNRGGGVADVAGARARSRRTPPLADRRPRPRQAPPPHHGADAAPLGQRRSHRPRELRQALRGRHRGQDGGALDRRAPATASTSTPPTRPPRPSSAGVKKGSDPS